MRPSSTRPKVAPPADMDDSEFRSKYTLPSKSEVENGDNRLQRILNAPSVKAVANRVGFDGSVRVSPDMKLKFREGQASLNFKF